MSGKFLYFAYGSNLLAQRIHINNPSAVRAGIAKLEDYRLDFVTYSKRWRGASATVIKKPGDCVWGALWEIDNQDMKHLDRQEGVHANIYRVLNLEVCLPNGSSTKCRLYQQTADPELVENLEQLPEDRRPSGVYLHTIIKGAEESGIPEDYIRFLKRIPHNGYMGDVDVELNLDLK